MKKRSSGNLNLSDVYTYSNDREKVVVRFSKANCAPVADVGEKQSHQRV